MNQTIYHITSINEWNAAQANGEYQPSQYDREGFIHCSYRHQLVDVANRLFSRQNNLLILAIAVSEVKDNLIEENLEGGSELYPHIYQKLPLTAVEAVIFFPNADGSFSLPKQLLTTTNLEQSTTADKSAKNQSRLN